MIQIQQDRIRPSLAHPFERNPPIADNGNFETFALERLFRMCIQKAAVSRYLSTMWTAFTEIMRSPLPEAVSKLILNFSEPA